MKSTFVLLTVLLASCSASAWAADVPCEDLTKLNLTHTEVTQAASVAKGAFPAPRSGPGQANPLYAALPGFCRVLATLRPTPDSDIKVELWLPAEGWNGRLEGEGDGGFGSNLDYSAMALAVSKGYASVATNTGHEGSEGTFAIGHPEKLVDWGNRAVHEMVVMAKAVIAARYGDAPKYSYFNSCSTGGRQAEVAAEYYPADFDGVVVGDPANPMTRLQANTIAVNMAFNKNEASFVPAEKWKMLHDAFLEKCDAVDGLKDGLVENPFACKFDVKKMLCRKGDAPDCLTASQITALNVLLSGSKNPRTGERLYPGYPLGAVLLPGPLVGKKIDTTAPEFYKALFQDPNWDYHTFDFDKDTARADKLGNNVVNASDETKLKAFFARGGKMLSYIGWQDISISVQASIDYYQNAVKADGGLAKSYDSVRLFLIPGMGHCQGGEGPNAWDKMEVITAWVEQSKAPDRIVASHRTAGQVDRTRPLCPYPQIAKYKGSGSIDAAENFVCSVP